MKWGACTTGLRRAVIVPLYKRKEYKSACKFVVMYGDGDLSGILPCKIVSVTCGR